MADLRIVGVPHIIIETLDVLNRALGQRVTLLGGWAIHCRLRLANRRARPTEDIDVVLRREMRPARAVLEAIDAVQDDPKHRARLHGLPVMVDLLADDAEEALMLEPGLVHDEDGLRLIVPPFADLFVLGIEPVELIGIDSSVTILLPSAGTLFASKVGCLYLEFREPEKKASDGLDALALLEAYGPVALAEHLSGATKERRAFLAERLDAVAYGGLAAQARAADGDPYPEGALAVPDLVRRLREPS